MFKSRKERQFEAEWDARLNDPTVHKDVMSSWRLGGVSEVRVQMPNGEMYRRNGEQCCGCGQAPRNIKPFRSPVPHPDTGEAHHHKHDDNDEPRGFFCSWL